MVQLKEGRHYRSKNGRIVTVLARTGRGGADEMLCQDADGRRVSYSRQGRFSLGTTSPLDLYEEVDPARTVSALVLYHGREAGILTTDHPDSRDGRAVLLCRQAVLGPDDRTPFTDDHGHPLTSRELVADSTVVPLPTDAIRQMTRRFLEGHPR